jgi:hypothetical protein
MFIKKTYFHQYILEIHILNAKIIRLSCKIGITKVKFQTPDT